MNKYVKAGLLIVTLVIPALIFTFLRFFATNHYNLPFYHPVTDSLGKVVMSGQDTVFYKVDPDGVSIKGQTTPLMGKAFENVITVVNYVQQPCSDSCQLLLSQLERVYAMRSGIPDIRLLSIAIDSLWKDTYPAQKGKEGWEMGVVNEGKSKELLYNQFRFQTKVPKSKTNSMETKLILIDRTGRIRGYYVGTDKEEIDRLMAEIKILDYEKNAME